MASYWQERLTFTETLIAAWEAAALAFAANGALQSYELDTGQSRQRVTRDTNIEGTLDALYNRRAMLNKRINGAAMVGGPAW